MADEQPRPVVGGPFRIAAKPDPPKPDPEPRIIRMAKWEDGKLSVEWTAGAPFVEVSIGATHAGRESVRLCVDDARVLHRVLGKAIGETQHKSEDTGSAK